MKKGDLVKDRTRDGKMGLVLSWYCATRGYAYIYFFGYGIMPCQEAYLEVVSVYR